METLFIFQNGKLYIFSISENIVKSTSYVRKLENGVITRLAGTEIFGNKLINTVLQSSPKVSFDNNNTMFIVDNQEIYKVLPSSGIVQRVSGGILSAEISAGTGAGGLALYSQISSTNYITIDQNTNDIYFTEGKYIK